jgi:hypothetical protein
LWLDRYDSCTEIEEYVGPIADICPNVEYQIAGSEEVPIKLQRETAMTDIFRAAGPRGS